MDYKIYRAYIYGCLTGFMAMVLIVDLYKNGTINGSSILLFLGMLLWFFKTIELYEKD